MRVAATGNAETARQAEICQFDHTFAIQKQILRFEIAVKHAVRVAICQALQKLPREALKAAELLLFDNTIGLTTDLHVHRWQRSRAQLV